METTGNIMQSTEVQFRARVFRCDFDGTPAPWYVDIDDPDYPQPDQPLWYAYYDSQAAALDAACSRLAALS
ncbi:MAG TPA: hypothetical protein VFB74_05355 [Kribbellaceae bacterium]|nr:hypothetical protein [Kribbellaceae bacterium]